MSNSKRQGRPNIPKSKQLVQVTIGIQPDIPGKVEAYKQKRSPRITSTSQAYRELIATGLLMAR